MAIRKLATIQHGKEASYGSTAAATFKWKGNGNLEFVEAVNLPEFDYAVGSPGNVEGAFVSSKLSRLTLADTPFSTETMIWLGNMSIKTVLGAATEFLFVFPTGSAGPNGITSFTWEVADNIQEYEFTGGFCESFSIHGDVGANNGQLLLNAVILGQAATASTVTAGLGFLANYEPLSIYNTDIHFDTIGTAPGSAAKTSGLLKAFNVDVKTGWHPGAYADGRTTLDHGSIEYGGYEITGRLRCLLNATAVTNIANARAGTPQNVEIGIAGTSSREVKIDMPIVFTAAPQIGDSEVNGLRTVEFPFRAGDSRTTTAAGVGINVTATASTTVT